MRLDILKRKDEILVWINENRPKYHICRELECKPDTLDSYLKKFGVAYKGDMGFGNRGKFSNQRLTVEQMLSGDRHKGTHKIKLRMLEDGFKPHECEKCHNTEWLDGPIPLELDHIDGDRRNWKINNLWLLCPNCHALQPTNSGKNKRACRPTVESFALEAK
jgi:hypothetical protein